MAVSVVPSGGTRVKHVDDKVTPNVRILLLLVENMLTNMLSLSNARRDRLARPRNRITRGGWLCRRPMLVQRESRF